MVKRSRRMTVAKKKSGGKKTKSSMKPTKGKKKQMTRSVPGGRKSSKPDRANSATKVLLKALKKKEE